MTDDFNPFGLNPGGCDVCGAFAESRVLLHSIYQSPGIRWLCDECRCQADQRLDALRDKTRRQLAAFLRLAKRRKERGGARG